MAVLAILAADFFCRSDHCRPHRCCGALWNRLPAEGILSLRSPLFTDLVDERLKTGRINMARKLGFNDSRMHSGGADAASTVAPVERDGEKYVRGFRAAVGDERFVGRSLKIGIVQIDVGITVTRGREVDQPAAIPEQRRNPVDRTKWPR